MGKKAFAIYGIFSYEFNLLDLTPEGKNLNVCRLQGRKDFARKKAAQQRAGRQTAFVKTRSQPAQCVKLTLPKVSQGTTPEGVRAYHRGMKW